MRSVFNRSLFLFHICIRSGSSRSELKELEKSLYDGHSVDVLRRQIDRLKLVALFMIRMSVIMSMVDGLSDELVTIVL